LSRYTDGPEIALSASTAEIALDGLVARVAGHDHDRDARPLRVLAQLVQQPDARFAGHDQVQ
jgi:hypothetical protein